MFHTLANEMPLTFLSLPAELRQTIYEYALRSSTGLVIYKRNLHIRDNEPEFALYAASPPSSQHYDPLSHEPISISLLQVSRQVFAETKDLVWALNVLVFSAVELPQRRLQYRIQHVLIQYRLDEDDRRGPTPLQRTIDVLGRWAKEGSLKSVTIRTREPLRHPYDSWEFVKRVVEGHLMRWKNATEEGGCLSRVFRMVIFTGLNLYALSNGCKPVVQLAYMQKELHKAVRGEVWTEGVLCWKDGMEVAKGWSAFEWVDDAGLLRPRILSSVQREIDTLPDEFEVLNR